MGQLQHDGRRYVWGGTFAERLLPKEAGFRWSPEEKIWWTDDHRKAEALFDYMLHSALDARAAWMETLNASRATNADIEIPAPAGCEYLPYQKAGIAYAASRRDVLIGDEMGLGKTIQAIGIINLDESIKTVLIVAPKSLLLNWRREADKWLTRGVDLTIINYDMLHKRADLAEQTWDLLVLDECQYIKNPKAKRTKAAMALQAKRRVLLTGTPILNRPVELWPAMQMLDPNNLGRNFFGFAKRYCDAKQVRVSRSKMAWDFSGASNLEELQDRMRQRFMVRRLKSEVLKELPAKRRQIIPLEPNGASRALKAEQKMIADLGFEEAARMLEGGSAAFTELAKLRHDLGVAKAEKAVEHITDMLDSTDKIVVFAHHHDVIDILKVGLEPYGCVTITGQTKDTDRQEAVDRFQTDDSCRVFIGNIKAAGVGLTLTAASTVVFVEQDWTPGWMQQAEDRCHRIGQTESVLIQYLVFDGSLDGVLANMLVNKAEVADRALDAEIAVKDMSEVKARVEVEEEKRKVYEAKRAGLAQERITEDQIVAVHINLKRLAGVCDGAKEKDGMGFNGFDAKFLTPLAWQRTLTPLQAATARRMLAKYKGQLGSDAVAAMF